MCIIAYVPSKVKISNETIARMFNNNDDGAGIMYKLKYNSPVEIVKGFYKVEDLIKAFRQIPETAERAIHCRISTAGDPRCVHPFPIVNDYKPMLKQKYTCTSALAHNGIISYCNPKGGLKADHSDTMEFIKEYAYNLRNDFDSIGVKKLVEDSTPSRFLIFRKGGNPVMWGDWVKDGGIYYSNTSYKYNYYYACSTTTNTGTKGAANGKTDAELELDYLVDDWNYDPSKVCYATFKVPKFFEDHSPKEIQDYFLDGIEYDFATIVYDYALTKATETEPALIDIAYEAEYGPLFRKGDRWEDFEVVETYNY